MAFLLPIIRNFLSCFIELRDILTETAKTADWSLRCPPASDSSMHLRAAEIPVPFKRMDPNILYVGHPAALRVPVVFKPYRPLRIVSG